MANNSNVLQDELFKKLEHQLGGTNNTRDIIITELMKEFTKITKKEGEMDAEDREAFSAFVNSLGKMLSNKDSSNINLVKLKLANDQVDATTNAAEVISEFLKSVSGNVVIAGGDKTQPPPHMVDEALDKRFVESGDKISDNELVIGSAT